MLMQPTTRPTSSMTMPRPGGVKNQDRTRWLLRPPLTFCSHHQLRNSSGEQDTVITSNIITSPSSLSPEVLEGSDVPGLVPVAGDQCEAHCLKLDMVGATGSPQ